MEKFEYKIVNVADYSIRESHEVINKFGADGWEMVTSVCGERYNGKNIILYFKRKLSE